MSFVGELKRRNVIRVAILYFISSWLLLQLTDVLSSILPVPDWIGSFVFMMLLICLAPALIFSWVYEMTPEGLKRESDIDRATSITPNTGKKINGVIIVLLVLAIVGMVVDRLLPEQGPQAELVAVQVEVGIPRNSIAVLPFADLSAEGNQQFFTDGLSEELLNLLVRIDGLKVASRTSSFAYRGSSLGIPEISNELGVAHILEGSVRKSGDRIRITAQLIEAGTDRHLWSNNFDRELDDIFAIQDEIGNAIVNALKDELGILEEVVVEVKVATSNVGAYELYLEARELFIKRERIDDSIRLFKEAIALDPEFARAWEGLAAAEAVADDWLAGDGIEHSPLAQEAASRALELDPELSMPYAVLSDIGAADGKNYLEAHDYLDLAIEKDPRNATAWLWRGISMNELGFFEEGKRSFEQCLAADPGYLNCKHHKAASFLYSGDERRALETYEPTLGRSFHSMSEVFVPVYAANGERKVALLLAEIKFGSTSAPVADWVNAVERPDEDHSAGLERWRLWEKTNNENLAMDDAPISYLAFGAYEEFASARWPALYLWHPHASGFRSSAVFKEFVRQESMLTYWQERGFPGFCRAVGDDDIECDDPR
jgi:adenylate cyclase